MKKHLNFFLTIFFSALTTINVVACNQKTVSSLEDANGYKIKANPTKPEGYKAEQYSDITYWSNNTISANNYKKIFFENFQYNIINQQKQKLNFYEMIKFTNSNCDDNAKKIDPSGSNINLPLLLLAEYEISSTNNKYKNDIVAAYNDYKKDFLITIYQNNIDIDKNPEQLQIERVENKYNPGKTFKISFQLGVDVTPDGNKNGFIGVRKLVDPYISADKDLSQFYQVKNTDIFLVDVNDKNLVGYDKTTNKVLYTGKNKFDYRFAINLVWTIN